MLEGNKKVLSKKPCCRSRELADRLFLLVTGERGKKKKLKIIIKKHNPECADIQYIFVKNVCLKETDLLGKIDQICFMSDSRAAFPRAEFLLSYRQMAEIEAPAAGKSRRTQREEQDHNCGQLAGDVYDIWLTFLRQKKLNFPEVQLIPFP